MDLEFYNKLISYKALNRLSWGDLGRVIDKEPATIRIAVNRKSLTNLEQKEFEKLFVIKKTNIKTPYEKTSKNVPYYDLDVTSHITTSFSDVPEKPTFYVDYQPFNDCSAYVNNYGDSMFPKYKNGEKLAVKQIHNLEVLMFGETYLVITNENANNLKTVKEVHYHEDKSKLILRAANPDYQGDTIINKVDILSMFAVKGKISQNFI